MEDYTNKHDRFFNALEEIPRNLDMKIINYLIAMSKSDEFLDDVVQTASPELKQTKVWGKHRIKTRNDINRRLNEIIHFIKNPSEPLQEPAQEPLQEQERIKDLIIKIKK